MVQLLDFKLKLQVNLGEEGLARKFSNVSVYNKLLQTNLCDFKNLKLLDL